MACPGENPAVADILLRNVTESDLPVLLEPQASPEAGAIH